MCEWFGFGLLMSTGEAVLKFYVIFVWARGLSFIYLLVTW